MTATTTEFEAPPAEPGTLAAGWLDRARADGVREPGAMALATVDARGRSSIRTVAVLGCGPGGVLFCSHDDSPKGRDIAATGWASGLLYWRETARQMSVAGPVERLTGAESDEFWFARPVATHAMSVASRQSAPMRDEPSLRAEAERLEALGTPLPRPPGWIGYRIRLASVEFWESDPRRMYRRLRYDLVDDRWTVQRLQP